MTSFVQYGNSTGYPNIAEIYYENNTLYFTDVNANNITTLSTPFSTAQSTISSVPGSIAIVVYNSASYTSAADGTINVTIGNTTTPMSYDAGSSGINTPVRFKNLIFWQYIENPVNETVSTLYLFGIGVNNGIYVISIENGIFRMNLANSVSGKNLTSLTFSDPYLYALEPSTYNIYQFNVNNITTTTQTINLQTIYGDKQIVSMSNCIYFNQNSIYFSYQEEQ
jgi:hypothetical protein